MKYAVGLLVVAACGSDGSGPYADAHISLSDANSGDAAPVPHGLLVSWRSDPALPGPVKTDVTVSSAVFHISRLQVIGDSGQPMTQVPITLGWSGESTSDPPTIGFPSAPGGLYSQIGIDLQPVGGASYEIRGTVKVGGMTKPFYIHDTAGLDFDIAGYTVNFTPGVDATLPVRIDIDSPITAVDWTTVQEVGGTLEVGPAQAQISEVRDKIDNVFKRGP